MRWLTTTALILGLEIRERERKGREEISVSAAPACRMLADAEICINKLSDGRKLPLVYISQPHFYGIRDIASRFRMNSDPSVFLSSRFLFPAAHLSIGKAETRSSCSYHVWERKTLASFGENTFMANTAAMAIKARDTVCGKQRAIARPRFTLPASRRPGTYFVPPVAPGFSP